MVDYVSIWMVLGAIVVLVIVLYQEIIDPALTFLLVVAFFLTTGIIEVKDFLSGFANEQILTIIILVLVTSELKRNFEIEKAFDWLFNSAKTPKAFLIRMMVLVSTISSVLNNTPVVAVMIPYVYNWSKSRGFHPSKLLIPLSFATILGGMITVVGTSTNLVLNGLLSSQSVTMLDFWDFFWPGVTVTLLGWAYLYTIGYNLLPAHKEAFSDVRAKAPEYLVETLIKPGSKLIGHKLGETGILSLKGVYLVELVRGGEVYQDISADFVLEEGDSLLFMGKTDTIVSLINANIGFSLAEQKQGDEVVEAIIPPGSVLHGKTINEFDFRNEFDAEVMAVHRNGKKLDGKFRSEKLQSGDMLLLSAGAKFMDNFTSFTDLYVIATAKKKINPSVFRLRLFWLGLAILLLLLALGYLSLFLTSAYILLLMLVLGMTKIKRLSKEVDIELFLMLISALSIGAAMIKTSAAAFLAGGMINLFEPMGTIGILVGLFISVVLLTAFVTNVAAVSIAFPIAYSLSQKLGIEGTPFYVAIAFAASGDFMTPIGYQTNLMVMGPGNYKFADFIRVGFPFTIAYTITVLTLIVFRYGLY